MQSDSNNSAFEQLKLYMIDNYNARLGGSGKKEIRIRCPICGDSQKDIKDRHMYIGLNRNGLISYICMLCNSSGLINNEFFRKLNNVGNTSPNIDIINTTLRYNNNILNRPENKILKDIETSKITNPRFFIRESLESEKKLNSINKRLGTSLTYDDLNRLKIIPNLMDFLNANNIREYTRHVNMMGDLDMFFMGFLSMDNSYINLRRLVPEGKLYKNIDRRYIQYNLFGKIDNSSRHYIIPSTVNTLDINPIKIHIAEGPFDILSIYLNLRKDSYQNIYTSIGGKSYSVMVKYFLETLGLINVEFHIYPDADIEDSKMFYIKDLLNPFSIPLYIHRNMAFGQKDMGVSLDKIEEKIYRIN